MYQPADMAHHVHDTQVTAGGIDTECSREVSLWDLPREHVWFEWILRRLTIRELFQFRETCSEAREMVREYFRYNFVIDLSQVGKKFNSGAFFVLTDDVENLRELILKDAKDWLTDNVLMPVLGSNSQLRRVDFTGCTNISNVALQVLASHCPELRELCLAGCHWVSQEGLTAVAMHCRKLEKLNLTSCWSIGAETVMTVVLFCKNITLLNLVNIYGLTDEAVCAIARCCNHLQLLNLKGCWRVTDHSIRILAEYCPSLKGLQVRECPKITETSLGVLRKRNVRLDIPSRFQCKRRAMIKLNLQI